MSFLVRVNEFENIFYAGHTFELESRRNGVNSFLAVYGPTFSHYRCLFVSGVESPGNKGQTNLK